MKSKRKLPSIAKMASGLMRSLRCACNDIWRSLRGDGERECERRHHGRERRHHGHRRRASSVTEKPRCRREHPSGAHDAGARRHKSSSASLNADGAAPRKPSCGAVARRAREPPEQRRAMDRYGANGHLYEVPEPVYDQPEGRDLPRAAALSRRRPASAREHGDRRTLQQDMDVLCADIEQHLSALEKSLESEINFYKKYISDARSVLTARASNICSRAALYQDYDCASAPVEGAAGGPLALPEAD